MFGIGFPEIIVILIIVFLVSDAKKISEIARALGKALKEFKRAQRSFDDDENLAG